MEEKGNDDSSSHMSFFNEPFDEEEEEENNQNENDISKSKDKESGSGSENQKILKFEEKFLMKKRKKLTEEEIAEKNRKNLERYCKRNDEMLTLLEKISKGETTHRNINRMMRLLAVDLKDTKKLINTNSLLFNQKKKIFQRLLNLTYQDYQLFWYKLTDGKMQKGNAQLIKSSNISKAKAILTELEESMKKKENEKNNEQPNSGNNEENDIKEKKKNRTIKEIIKSADMRDLENENLDKQFFENGFDVSDSSSLSSSLSESDDEDEENNSSSNLKSDKNNIQKEKEEKEKNEKEKKEKEEKERLKREEEEKLRKEKENKEKERLKREEEEKLRKEKENKEKEVKKYMEEQDDIDIFN